MVDAESDDPVELFLRALKFVRENGFEEDIVWCETRPPFDNVDEEYFLRQYAWVVFNSGMRNKVISEKWGALYSAFEGFVPSQISLLADQVRKRALSVFNNKRKVDAVINVANKICDEGYVEMRGKIIGDPLNELDALPFIGSITKYHLARNLGFDFIKPDRHLVRLAAKYGMNPFELCNIIHEKTAIRLGTIDVILWRFMEQKGQARLGGYDD